MIQAYLDESGIHEGARLCVVGGFIGSVKQWSAFETLWNADAASPGFHAKQFFARSENGKRVGPYADWSDDRAGAFLSRLLASIAETDIKAFGAGIDIVAFRGYPLAERKAMTGAIRVQGKWKLSGAPTRPYYLPFQWAIIRGLSLLKRKDWKVHFVFDQQHQFAPYALRMYNYIKTNTEHSDISAQMGDADFKSRYEAPPLQAADLLAYTWNRLLSFGRNRMSEELIGAADSFTKKGDVLHFFSKEVMDKLLGHIALSPGGNFRV